MEVLPTKVRTGSPEFAANRERMAALVAELRERTARAREGGGARYLERHRQQGKLPVRERIEQLLDPETPFLELSALAASDLYDNEAPAAGVFEAGRKTSSAGTRAADRPRSSETERDDRRAGSRSGASDSDSDSGFAANAPSFRS